MIDRSRLRSIGLGVLAGMTTVGVVAAGVVLAVEVGRFATVRARTPPQPAAAAATDTRALDAQALVLGDERSASVKIRELLNVELSKRRLQVEAIDVTGAMRLDERTAVHVVQVRSRGSIDAAAAFLTWVAANHRSIAVENVTATAAADGGAWSMTLLIFGTTP